jgi:hypothetical protein
MAARRQLAELELADAMVGTGGAERLTPLQMLLRMFIFLVVGGLLGYGGYELFRRFG